MEIYYLQPRTLPALTHKTRITTSERFLNLNLNLQRTCNAPAFIAPYRWFNLFINACIIVQFAKYLCCIRRRGACDLFTANIFFVLHLESHFNSEWKWKLLKTFPLAAHFHMLLFALFFFSRWRWQLSSIVIRICTAINTKVSNARKTKSLKCNRFNFNSFFLCIFFCFFTSNTSVQSLHSSRLYSATNSTSNVRNKCWIVSRFLSIQKYVFHILNAQNER